MIINLGKGSDFGIKGLKKKKGGLVKLMEFWVYITTVWNGSLM